MTQPPNRRIVTEAALDADVAARLEDPDSEVRRAGNATYAQSVNLDTYPGVDPSGVAECAAACNAAANAALARGVPLVGAGSYKISTTFTIETPCDLSNATILADMATGVAVDLVAGGYRKWGKAFRLPFVENIVKQNDSSGWGAVAGTIGIRIRSTQHARIEVAGAFRSEIGLQLWGDTADEGAVAYNQIELGRIDAKIGMDFNGVDNGDNTSGYTNQNTIIGGRLGLSESGTALPGTRMVRMSGGHFPADGNVFVGTSLEHSGNVEAIIECHGWWNTWDGCRYESTPTPGSRTVMWKGAAHHNRIVGGYDSDKIVQQSDTSTHDNVVETSASAPAVTVPSTVWLPVEGVPVSDVQSGQPMWTLPDSAATAIGATVTIPDGWTQARVSLVWTSVNVATGAAMINVKAKALTQLGDVGWAPIVTGEVVSALAVGKVQIDTIATAFAVSPGPMLLIINRDGEAAVDTLSGGFGLVQVALTRVA